jgi:hypothetical protein
VVNGGEALSFRRESLNVQKSYSLTEFFAPPMLWKTQNVVVVISRAKTAFMSYPISERKRVAYTECESRE